MKTEYTKGPWIYYKLNDLSGFEISQKEVLTGLPTRSAIVPYGDSEGEANARLIAAAPELLEALQKCLPYLQAWIIKDIQPLVGESMEEDLKMIELALKKAKGL